MTSTLRDRLAYSPSPSQEERDQVAKGVEALLCFMESEGMGAFNRLETSAGCNVSFGELSAQAPTFDIALIRIATAMLDHPTYSLLLRRALLEPMIRTKQRPAWIASPRI